MSFLWMCSLFNNVSSVPKQTIYPSIARCWISLHRSTWRSVVIGSAFVLRLFIGTLLFVISAGCAEDAREYSLASTMIESFEAETDTIAAQDDRNSPAAMSVLAGNTIGARPGVQVWNPEPTLTAMGISNGDLIILVDGELPSREYGSSFAPGVGMFKSSAHQYVDFVSGLLARRHSGKTLTLSVHHQYRTIKEREDNGDTFTKKPTTIRVSFK